MEVFLRSSRPNFVLWATADEGPRIHDPGAAAFPLLSRIVLPFRISEVIGCLTTVDVNS